MAQNDYRRRAGQTKRKEFEAQLEAEHGDLMEVIPSLVNRIGQQRAASKLGVSQYWVSQWLARNGFVKIELWAHDTETTFDLTDDYKQASGA